MTDVLTITFQMQVHETFQPIIHCAVWRWEQYGGRRWSLRFHQQVKTSKIDMKQDHPLTHWGRVTHICVGNLTIIGPDNGLSPGRRQAITWANDGILLIRPLGTNFSEILIEIHTFSFKKMRFKLSSGKWRPFYLGLNVLKIVYPICWCRSKDTGKVKFSLKLYTLFLKRLLVSLTALLPQTQTHTYTYYSIQ